MSDGVLRVRCDGRSGAGEGSRCILRGETGMANYKANDVLRLTRRAAGLSQEALCDGICSAETLSRIECGKTRVKQDIYRKLMQRMERNPEKRYAVCTGADVDLLEEMVQLENAMAKYEYGEADRIFSRIKDKIGTEPENVQFVQQMEAELDELTGRIDIKTAEERLEAALQITAPDYRRFLHNKCAEVFPFTEREMIILVNIAYCKAKQGDNDGEIVIYNMLLKCLKNGYMLIDEHTVQIQLLVMRNLAYSLGRKGKYKAAMRMTESVIQMSKKYDYGYKLVHAINDSSWIHRCLYVEDPTEEDYRLAKLQYRQAYYLALARGDYNFAAKLRNGYKKFFDAELAII